MKILEWIVHRGDTFNVGFKYIQKQGYVGGAIYNSDHTVSQTISYDKELLSQIRSSKYLQSNAEGIYRHIQSLLKQDKLVFFVAHLAK